MCIRVIVGRCWMCCPMRGFVGLFVSVIINAINAINSHSHYQNLSHHYSYQSIFYYYYYSLYHHIQSPSYYYYFYFHTPLLPQFLFYTNTIPHPLSPHTASHLFQSPYTNNSTQYRQFFLLSYYSTK